MGTIMDNEKPVWPERLTLRDTRVIADEGQRIFSTATGYGYETREYVRADVMQKAVDELRRDFRLEVAEKSATHYVLPAPRNCFVKEAEYFIDQGGLEMEWGRNWEPVVAGSIEEARKLGAELWANKAPELPIEPELEPRGSSFPFMAIAKRSGVPYGELLRIAEYYRTGSRSCAPSIVEAIRITTQGLAGDDNWAKALSDVGSELKKTGWKRIDG